MGKPSTAPRAPDPLRDGLLRDYMPLPGAPDELFLPDGVLRPVWQPFLSHLQTLTPDAIQARFQRGNHYLREAGVFYRKYGEDSAGERDWPLSHIPVLLDSAEWQAITDGLTQRADLLEEILCDLYGPADLVRDGHLPASLIAQNPAWLRPMVNVKPRSGHFLNFVAFEIGRGPSGQWWVLGDRTDAPSGAGFALENRVATTRVFPNYYARSNVQRLAGFFQAFRASLDQMRDDPSEPIGLLTPGQMNDGYFEHAYLARYLGFLLVEGEDLMVSGGRLQVRTVEGLRPISVLWRRVDSEFCDPLELNEDSKLGTAGMVDMVRRGALAALNTPGAGLLESRGLMAFLPKIAMHLTGAPLQLPNIATWWCGQSSERAEVVAQRARLSIASAYATRLPHDDPTARTEVPDQPEALARYLETHGHGLVGQENVLLSTTPVWKDDRLVPRPMTLRVFLARTEDGWSVMPGGYARIGADPTSTAVAMQAGGAVSDVWIVHPEETAQSRVTPGLAGLSRTANPQHTALPARAADNLFWLGRYIERAESAMRAFRAYFGLRVVGMSEDDPLARLLQNGLLNRLGSDAATLAQSFEEPIENAVLCAARIRDRFSVDGMLALKDLSETAKDLGAQPIPLEEVPHAIGILLRKVTGFSGLVHENMFRSAGWRFLSLGLSLERAVQMSTTLIATLDDNAPEGAFDLALEMGDSTMSHRARFLSAPNALSVAAHLALEARNPRSIHYHLARAKDQIEAMPRRRGTPGLSGPARLALSLQTEISVARPEDLTPAFLIGLRTRIFELSDQVQSEFLA